MRSPRTLSPVATYFFIALVVLVAAADAVDGCAGRPAKGRRWKCSEPYRPRVMHGLSARADVKRSQGRAQARY